MQAGTRGTLKKRESGLFSMMSYFVIQRTCIKFNLHSAIVIPLFTNILYI